MTFDEAINELGARNFGHRDLLEVLKELRETYAPTVEMTKAEKDLFTRQMKVIKEEGKHVNNFEYFVNALTFSNDLHDNALDRLLDEYQTDSKQLMLAWLYPELIKVVESNGKK
ncbi:hypothetical protein [Weissella cibaria]|uniref:hypothetical protein n=1 Tax=Weissella cibaria TaxID=137591 RepID=UPI0013DA56F0|nr:hypothetical protein [Weissella cibaria]NFA02006.1 hypothetical protein [Weissella cibaria]